MKRKKVAVVVPSLSSGGGVSTMARFIFRTLSESEEFNVDYVSLATSSRDATSVRLLDPKSWFRAPKVQVKDWDSVFYRHVGCIWAEFEFQRYRPRRVLTEILKEYDLIQVVAGGPATAWAATNTNRPICLFVATTSIDERASLMTEISCVRKPWLEIMTRITSKIERHVLPRMTHVFAESEYTRRLIMPFVAPQRLSIGFPGVDTNTFSPRDYCSDGYILAVGRWADPRKNVRLLFEAYHQLSLSRPETPSLVLVGISRPRDADWSYAQALGIADRVEIKEAVPDNQLPEVYRHASLFVLSSNEEGLGIVILEAMASGLPVVSTRCGGPESAIVEGETGLLTSVGQATEFALAMQLLLEDPALRQHMGETGRRRVERVFSSMVAGRNYLKVYRSILNISTNTFS